MRLDDFFSKEYPDASMVKVRIIILGVKLRMRLPETEAKWRK